MRLIVFVYFKIFQRKFKASCISKGVAKFISTWVVGSTGTCDSETLFEASCDSSGFKITINEVALR